jgi:hypothetical protein
VKEKVRVNELEVLSSNDRDVASHQLHERFYLWDTGIYKSSSSRGERECLRRKKGRMSERMQEDEKL